MPFRTVILFGPPGSGKGTQGKILGAMPAYFHCACGDVFRSLDPASEMGQEFAKYSKSGSLVPDELTVRLWRQAIHEKNRLAANISRTNNCCYSTASRGRSNRAHSALARSRTCGRSSISFATMSNRSFSGSAEAREARKSRGRHGYRGHPPPHRRSRGATAPLLSYCDESGRLPRDRDARRRR